MVDAGPAPEGEVTVPPASSRWGVVSGQAFCLVAAALLAAWALRANDEWLERHMTTMYCVARVGQLTKLHVLRGVAMAVAGVLAIWLRPRAGRWAGRWASRNGLRGAGVQLATIVLALLLAIIVSDLFLRWRRGRSATTASAEAFNRGVPVTRDERGFRLIHGRSLDAERDTVIFGGESVTFGWGLADDETIAARVGEELDIQTRNIAVSGSANDEALMRLREELPRCPRPRAVVTFVLLNWLYRNIGLHRDHLVLGADGRLRIASPIPEWLSRSPLWESARAIYHEADPVELVRVILRETATTARNAGAYPLFVFTQCGEECISNGRSGPRILDRLVEEQDFDSIRIAQDKSLRLPNDIHPNAEGARRMAATVARALRERGIGHVQ